MKKSNSKTLYRFTKELKQKQNVHQAPQDSFDIVVPPTKKKKSHNRTQSCPYSNEPSASPAFTQVKKRQSSYFSWNTAPKQLKKLQKVNQTSRISTGSKTVIVRDVGLEPISSMLWHGGKKTVSKKGGTCWKGIFSKNQINQQIRSYQLREQLKQIQRKNQEAAIKQRILQSLLSNCEVIHDNSFEFA